jgi:PUA-domain protein
LEDKVKRRFVREKQSRELLSDLFRAVRIDAAQVPSLKPPIELAEVRDLEVFLIEARPVFAKYNDRIVPTLLASPEILSRLPRAIVNMGAVPYVCNGADIMAPGIVSFEGTFDEGDLVLVSDERHGKPLAITEAICKLEDARQLSRGKILRNLHHIGDTLWQAMKQLG